MISTEARGRARAYRRALVARTKQLEALLSDPIVCADSAAMAFRGSALGRERAYSRLNKRLRPFAALDERGRHTALWSFLRYGPSVPDPSDPRVDLGMVQDAICVEYLIAGKIDNRVSELASGLWTLAVPDHALGRFFERSPKGDPTASIRAAHRALLAADGQALLDAFTDERRLYVPAPGGAFVGQLYAVKRHSGRITPWFQARTWYDDGLLTEKHLLLEPASDKSKRSIFSIFMPAALLPEIRALAL